MELFEAKMAELIKTKEEIKNARDHAARSWLDSRPVIDKLNKLQAGLASLKNRTSMSKIVFSELKMQLEEVDANIRLKKEEELKAMKLTNEIKSELDEKRKELESIKKLSDEEQRARAKLKLVLQMGRQNLRALQLMSRAVRMESEAFAASLAEAEKYMNINDTENGSNIPDTVKLTQEEYYALKKRAKEETSLAEWRISVSLEQRLAAQGSKNSALSRLRRMYAENASSRRSSKVEIITEDEESVVEEVGEEVGEKVRRAAAGTSKAKPKAPAAAKSNNRNQGGPKHRVRKSGRHRNMKLSNKKQKQKLSVSVLQKIRTFLDCS